MPMVHIGLYRRNRKLMYKYYQDYYPQPIIVQDFNRVEISENISYRAGDTFQIKVEVNWGSSPAKDYTLKIYSKHTLQIIDE